MKTFLKNKKYFMLSTQPASSMINKSEKKIVERAIYITAIVQKLHGHLEDNMIASCMTHLGLICRDKSQSFARPSVSLNRASFIAREIMKYHEILSIVRTVHIFILFVQISSSCFKLSLYDLAKGSYHHNPVRLQNFMRVGVCQCVYLLVMQCFLVLCYEYPNRDLIFLCLHSVCL